MGEIICFHIRDALYQNGKIQTANLRPICRLAGLNYAVLGEIVTQSALGTDRYECSEYLENLNIFNNPGACSCMFTPVCSWSFCGISGGRR